MSGNNISRRKALKNMSIGAGTVLGTTGMGAATDSESSGNSTPEIETLAKNDKQTISKITVGTTQILYRDIHQSNRGSHPQVADRGGKLRKSGSGKLQVITGPTERKAVQTQGELPSSETKLADQVTKSNVEVDGTSVYINGADITQEGTTNTESVTPSVSVPDVSLDDLFKSYEYYAYQFGTCGGLAYSTHNYLGIAAEFTDNVETIISGGVGSGICHLALKKLTVPAKWLGLADVSCGALISVPASELVGRKYTGGFYDKHGSLLNEEKVGYGYGFELGKYHIPDAYEVFSIPGVHTEVIDYLT